MNPEAGMYQISKVAQASGAEIETIKTWIKRGILVLGPDDVPAETRRSARLFSFETVIQIATMHEFTQLGISPTRAAKWAISFAHWGDGKRNPSALYPDGETYLFGLPNSDIGIVRNVQAGKSVQESINRPTRSFVAINMFKIVLEVRERLGLPRE
jgi:hypothetical protein